MLNFCFFNPQKGTSLHGVASFDILCMKIGSGASAVVGRTPKRSRVNIFDAQFHAYGEKKPLEGS